MGVYFWTEYIPRTFTISWEEKSDMSSGWTYSDDAAGLTAGSTDFDEFFGYSGVRLNGSGVETASITQEASGGAGKLDITQLGTLTTGDNVMIKFPVRGIKMSKSGSVVTLSITEELNKAGYQYYAHCTGTLSNPGTPKDAFYLGTYIGASTGDGFRSRSGQTPYGSQYQSYYCTIAKQQGTGYNIEGFYQRMYINALYMMKYGNPDSQSVVGKGRINAGSYSNTGGTNSQTNATYGVTSDEYTQMKLFGLEDWWGNVAEHIGGAYFTGTELYVQLNGYSGAYSGGEATGATVNGSGQEMSGIVGSNNGMFLWSSVANNSSYNTYYCDQVNYNTTNRLLVGGGFRTDTTSAGIFNIKQIGNGQYSSAMGARLLYLN